MASLMLVDSRELMAEHQSALREYATRVVLRGETLAPHEEEDKARRMEEFRAIASSFELTGSDLVGMVFNGVLRERRGCGCPLCREGTGS